mgnify:CR=1 FL=1
MSSINEQMVREYFEMLGYFVLQPCKYVVPGRSKTPEEEVDLLAYRPGSDECRMPNRLVWSTREFRFVNKALIRVCGWHTERFSVARLLQSPEILRFAKEESVRAASRLLGPGPAAKILCLPQLPASETLKGKTLETLRAHGVDGVLPFPVMVREMALRVNVQRNYEKSDVLQILRILKAYGFLTPDLQLPLFGRRARRPSTTAGGLTDAAANPRPDEPPET